MPEVGYCRDCKWWERWNPNDAESEAEVDPMTCRLMLFDRVLSGNSHPESKAQARDSDNYLAWVITAPDFGCVQFTKRES